MQAAHPSSSPFKILPPAKYMREFAQLVDENSLAREAMERLTDIAMAEQVHIHCTPEDTPGTSAVVQRLSLLRACSSGLDSLHAFLKEQLGIAADQDIRVSWSDYAEPGNKQVQLAPETTSRYQLAYIVGRAGGWFVSVKQ